jgi:hypothetical protein
VAQKHFVLSANRCGHLRFKAFWLIGFSLKHPTAPSPTRWGLITERSTVMLGKIPHPTSRTPSKTGRALPEIRHPALALDKARLPMTSPRAHSRKRAARPAHARLVWAL